MRSTAIAAPMIPTAATMNSTDMARTSGTPERTPRAFSVDSGV
jgi:hypothetical protein